MSTKFKQPTGFTLSEVLITLGIIGVIAALTIPSLLNDMNNKELKTAWKKAYSELSNAQQMMVSENGSVEDTFDDITSDNQGSTNLQIGWLKYLNYTKKCDVKQSISQGCWYSTYIKYYDNTSTWSGTGSGSTSSSAILNNGMLLLFYPGTTGDFSTMNPSANSSDMYVFVDVNGAIKPNTFGNDVFALNYSPLKHKFVAFGEGSTLGCSGIGFNCSAYYLYNE